MPKRTTPKAKSQTSNLVEKLGATQSRPVTSEKMKSTASGFQTKFNKINVSNFVTGGSSSTSPGTNYGNQSTIHSIAGKKVGTATQIPQLAAPENIETKGNDSLVSSLAKMFSFMQQTRDDDVKRRETEMSFAEEQQTEEQKRHEQFLKVLRDYTSGGTTTIVQTEKQGEGLGGILDLIKSMVVSMIASAVSGLKTFIEGALKVYEWVKDLRILTKLAQLGPTLLRFVAFLSGPIGLALIGATSLAAFLYMANEEKLKIEANPNAPEYKDNAYAMSLRGEVKNIGQGAAQNQRKALKQVPRRTVEEFVKSDFSDTELKQELGNDRPTLQKWLQDNPSKGAMYQAPVAAFAGQPNTAIPAGGLPQAKTTVATPLLEGVTPSTAGGGRGSINPEMPTESTPTAEPVPPTPATSSVNDVIAKNADLVMNESTSSGSGGASPIIASSSNSTSSPDKAMSSSATQRDDTAIINRVFDRVRGGV